MEKLKFILDNWERISIVITFCITSIITLASAIVKLLPTLKQDNPVLPIVKGLSIIAMNRNVDDNYQRKVNEVSDIGKINEKEIK
jgi:hypothetical protein